MRPFLIGSILGAILNNYLREKPADRLQRLILKDWTKGEARLLTAHELAVAKRAARQ